MGAQHVRRRPQGAGERGQTNFTNNDDTLALGATFGIDYLINERWDAGAACRFPYFGGFDSGPMLTGESFQSDHMT